MLGGRTGMSGDCNKCEFYIEDRCFKAEKFFSAMTDPICLQKVDIMTSKILCDLVTTLIDLHSDEKNGEGEPQ